MHLPSKLPDVGTTIFTVMTKLAIRHNAINLSQGFPDFDCDPELIALVDKYMREGHNQYAPMQGVPVLRERIAEKTHELYGAKYDSDTEITVSSGATEALFAVITAVVQKGDEVIIFEPAYDSYEPAVKLNGGIPVHIRLKFPDYHSAWDEVANAISPRTKLMIFNTPHNPTGAVMTADDISALQNLVRDTNILLLSDEVYEHIIFDNLNHEGFSRYPDLAERSFVVSSFGKTYHTTGWKLGYCLAPAPLTTEFRKVHQFLTFASNTPMQLAYAEYLQKKEKYLELPEFYQQKRDKFLSLVKNSRFRIIPCHGTYFQMMDYSDISDEPDFDFAERLTAKHNVVAIPPSVFYHDRHDEKVLRFCFAKKDETLEKAAEKLCRI
jgi:methionine aminotransferase